MLIFYSEIRIAGPLSVFSRDSVHIPYPKNSYRKPLLSDLQLIEGAILLIQFQYNLLSQGGEDRWG